MVDLEQIAHEPPKPPSERRRTSRFPVQQEIRYRLVQARGPAHTGVGNTLDVSSGGILFTTSHPLPVGRLVEISMHWPAQLNGTCPLQFVAAGRVVRSERDRAAMRIQRYEFRTRSLNPVVARVVGA